MHTRTLRKKLAVRQALGSAALRLAVERGLENVTVEDITAEADVSLRTFGAYRQVVRTFSQARAVRPSSGLERTQRGQARRRWLTGLPRRIR